MVGLNPSSASAKVGCLQGGNLGRICSKDYEEERERMNKDISGAFLDTQITRSDLRKVYL